MYLTPKGNWFPVLLLLAVAAVVTWKLEEASLKQVKQQAHPALPLNWQAPSLYLDYKLEGPEREQVIYGEELITHTSRYFGPTGSIAPLTNGMNCQNCHLDAGTRTWGNNYGAVAATYPKFRDRSGTLETIAKRVNDCFERSLNGSPIDTAGKEMQAIISYIKWIGQDVPKGTKPEGSGIRELNYLTRAADPRKGKILYQSSCQSCHGASGEGLLSPNGNEYAYPPLWGPHSYNTGAGLYRLSRFAGYIKDNMPFNQSSHQSPALTDEAAWDLAAFVNSQPRPGKDLQKDWPDISKKPIDHPFGPYADGFSEKQHKYGPFDPIIAARKSAAQKKN